MAALVVIGVASLAIAMAAVDPLFALSGAATAILPLVAAWTSRQTGNARLLLRLNQDPPLAGAASSGLAVRAVAMLCAVLLAAGTLAVAIVIDRAAISSCPEFTIDAPIRDWWQRHSGRVGVGCPAGDTLTGAHGVRYTPWTQRVSTGEPWQDFAVYSRPAAEPMLLPMAILLAWIAEGGPAGPLGQPLDGGVDSTISYQHFHGGFIMVSPGAAAEVHFGQRYSRTRDPASPCARHDRPCITAAYAESGRIHLRWQYGRADAFNLAWWPENDPAASASREVAGYEVSLPNLRAGTAYLFQLIACDKHFLRRSTCTGPSDRVIVRVE